MHHFNAYLWCRDVVTWTLVICLISIPLGFGRTYQSKSLVPMLQLIYVLYMLHVQVRIEVSKSEGTWFLTDMIIIIIIMFFVQALSCGCYIIIYNLSLRMLYCFLIINTITALVWIVCDVTWSIAIQLFCRSQCYYFFSLSWVITWFGHVIQDISVVTRLVDVILASHPLMPIYLSAMVSDSSSGFMPLKF